MSSPFQPYPFFVAPFHAPMNRVLSTQIQRLLVGSTPFCIGIKIRISHSLGLVGISSCLSQDCSASDARVSRDVVSDESLLFDGL